MAVRLVQIEDRRRVATTAIRDSEFQIGRDPTSDLILDFARVSRRHALIQPLGDRHTIVDQESSNGTTLNGTPVGTEPVLLRPGDVIELAQTVVLIYETGEAPNARGWIGAAAAMLAVFIAAAGLLTWRLSQDTEIPTRAVTLAAEGREAFDRGDGGIAKARLQEAAGILFHDGWLEDVPRADVMRVAMERLGAELPGRPDLWQVFQRSLEQAAAAIPTPVKTAERGCRLDRVDTAQLDACLRERIELVLIELRQDPTTIPDDFHETVARRIRHEHRIISEALVRGKDIVPMLRMELEAVRMPPLLHYLALVESGYDPKATSPANAAGLWQFMPGTARQYGMRVQGGSDERRDPVKSTRAAARYLRDLAFEFGGDALLLALAGYNRGENGVRRALKKLEDPFSDRTYWRLVEEGLLPTETAKYVTRFVAAAVCGEGGVPDRKVLEAAGY